MRLLESGLLAAVLAQAFFCQAQAADASKNESIAFRAGIESFRWKEFIDGRQAVEETGERFTFSARVDNFTRITAKEIFGVEGRFYLGEIDYDGETNPSPSFPTPIPVMLDVDYVGVNMEAMAGRRFQNMDILGTVGIETWVREANNGFTVTGLPVRGFEEYYFILYARIGPGFLFQGKNTYTYVQFGLKYPFYTSEVADTSAVSFEDDVELSPGKRLSGYVKLRLEPRDPQRSSRLALNLYYDSFRFSESNSEAIAVVSSSICGTPICNVVQPKSEMDVFGAQLEYLF